MTTKRHNPIPERKTASVKELETLLKTKKTLLLASIRGLPASQFQEIGKQLRDRAVVKVPKKNLFLRALDASKVKGADDLKAGLESDVAFLFSDKDGYELAADLLKSKSPAKAKPGQIAPFDIEVQPGPTSLTPGPAISELGALGIQIQIKGGKIEIKEPRVIAKEGNPISQGAADIMAKLDIKPFSIGFIPLSTLDLTNGTYYASIEIDTEKAREALLYAYGRGLPFAVSIGYATPETITFMIQKAAAHEKALSQLEPQEEKREEAPSKEAKEAVPEEQPAEDTAADATDTPEAKTEGEEK